MKEKHIVSFSGGKDSTAMLLKMIELNYKIDEIIFIDTGVEFPEMYKHIHDIENYINRPITILKSDKSFEYYMFDHIKTRGKRKGQKGYSWSDFRNRWCTKYLKIDVIGKYLKKYKQQGYKIIEYHGIAIDEPKRIKEHKYPLVDWGMTEKDCLEYCYSKGFYWSGLYEKFHRLSCWCCPLQSLKELKVLYNEFPELWNKLKEWDNNTYRQFRVDYSVEDLERKFENESTNIKTIRSKNK